MLKRNVSIDLIKIIATLMVLMLHTNLYLSRSSYPLLLVVRNISGIAIPLFFSVSGYLMAGKQYESLNQSVNYSICKVLNILKRENIKATFFVNGMNCVDVRNNVNAQVS